MHLRRLFRLSTSLLSSRPACSACGRSERDQLTRLAAFKANRDHELVARRLDELRAAAKADGNLMYPIREALRDRCSMGEVCGAMRDVFGRYQARI